MTTTSSNNSTKEFYLPEEIINGKRLNTKQRGKAKYLLDSSKQGTVEQLALEHYQTIGSVGVWSENDYWWQILAYLYWDVIYAKIYGVYNPGFGPFPNRLQDMPSDLFSSEFYIRRKDLFSKKDRLYTKKSKLISRKSIIKSRLTNSYNYHKDDPCRLIEETRQYNLGDLELAVRYLTKEQLVLILKRLYIDFNNNRSGLPDLFLIKDDVPSFVEVKREKERIAQNQLNWLEYLHNTVGVKVRICRVHDEEVAIDSTSMLNNPIGNQVKSNESTKPAFYHSLYTTGINLFHEELANVRALRKQGKLDEADNLLMNAVPTPAVLDEIRKNASLKAMAARKNGDWYSVIKHLEGYEKYAAEHHDYCISKVNQAPPEHTDTDKKLLALARSMVE